MTQESNSRNPWERYSRQVLFPAIGSRGQELIRRAKVAVVGCGAIGASTCTLLARAGIGTLHIVDRDYVEESNLQRQLLFDEADAAQSLPKAEAAKRKLATINSEVAVEAHVKDLTADSASLLGDADLVLDCTDNFETRYLINDFAVSRRKPWIYAAAVGAYTLTMNIVPGDTACLACVFPARPSGTFLTCDTAGILNSASTSIAAIQVAEALKMLVGDLRSLRRTLLAFDLWSNERSEVKADSPRPDCRVCQVKQFDYLAGKGRPAITLCGRNSVQIHERERPVDFQEIASRLASHGEVLHNEMILKFRRESYEMTIFTDGRAIVRGTTDPAVARSLYARFIGN